MTDNREYKTDCRLFTGFSPCHYRRSCRSCPHYEAVDTRILLVQLGLLGDVLRTTSLLPAIRRRYPRAHITWLTRPEAAEVLRENPLVDRVLRLGEATGALLASLQFDIALCPDKELPACSLMQLVQCEDKRGFTIDANGSIVPLGESAHRLYELGLDNYQKFFVNEKTEQHLMTEALGFEYAHDRYIVVLTDRERRWALEDRRIAGVGDSEVLIGWNTGCSARYPYKKLTVEDQVHLMETVWQRTVRKDRVRFALLGGGAEDETRNRRIGEMLSERQIPVTQTPCLQGVRRGLAAVAGCDMVVSGDSLGMHMAIGLKKPTVAWFGITCHQEIDLYGRGIKVLSEVPCRPCWLQRCQLKRKCYRHLPWPEMSAAIVDMATSILEEGRWAGDHVLGAFPPENRIEPPLGVSPGPVL
ncbi:MAG: heptosyltransferase [Deltaproteobacteria bacterium]|nr:heptosyltransferase [Deltaproteobacteria bacterium]